VVIKDGAVHVIDSAFGGERVIPFDRLGTVVLFPPREMVHDGESPVPTNTKRKSGMGANLFSYGGLIILDVNGRMVGHLAYELASNTPIAAVGQQIPAPNHVQFPPVAEGAGYDRKAFKKSYPHALRFTQLWGASRWVWTILGFVFIVLPVGAILGVLVAGIIYAFS